MQCPDCGRDAPDDAVFCRVCGTNLTSTDDDSSDEQPARTQPTSSSEKNTEPTDETTGTEDDPGEKYVHIFAVGNLFFALIFALGFAFLWSRPLLFHVTTSGGITHYQPVNYGPILLVLLGFFSISHGITAVGVWKGSKGVWYFGMAITILTFLYLVSPPPTWLLVLVSGGTLYGGYRSRNSVENFRDKPPSRAQRQARTPLSTSTGVSPAGGSGTRNPNPSSASTASTSVSSTGRNERVTQSRSSIFGSSVWMGVVSLLLFWLPALGPLIAGYVGGKKAGGVGRGIAAAILPALVVGAIVWVLLGMIDLPVIGAAAGGLVTLVLAAHSIGLVAGAVIGGALS